MNLGGINWLDLVLFLAGIVGLGVGFAQGLLRQVIGLAALYIAAILAAQYFNPAGNFLRSILFQPTSRFLNALAFLIIIGGVWLIVTWLAFDAYQNTKIRLFPLLDHLGGSLLGLVSIIVAITFILPVINFAVSEPWPGNETLRFIIVAAVKTSRLVPIFDALKPMILSALGPWLPFGLPSIFTF